MILRLRDASRAATSHASVSSAFPDDSNRLEPSQPRQANTFRAAVVADVPLSVCQVGRIWNVDRDTLPQFCVLPPPSGRLRSVDRVGPRPESICLRVEGSRFEQPPSPSSGSPEGRIRPTATWNVG